MRKFLIIAAVFSSIFIIEQAWAQDSNSFGEGLFENPFSFFHTEGKAFEFLLFVIGTAIYAVFVWYFYRFIARRDMLPKLFYPVTSGKNVSKVIIARDIAIYAVVFPVIIFLWFIVLAFFVYFMGVELTFDIAVFVSMSIIATVRIVTYYRDDAAKEIAKLIPYALLAFFLTSGAVYENPNFFTEKNFNSIPEKFVEHFEGIITAVLIITIFEYCFRFAFVVKRRFFPVFTKKLDDQLEEEIDDRIKIHYKKMDARDKKMDEKEKNLEKKFEEMMKKLKDSEKI